MQQCPTEPCLYRYLLNGDECFLIQYVDDSLIAGHPKAIEHLKQEMRKYFECKFVSPKDFLGLDLNINKPGLISLAMNTFTSKMIAALSIHNDHPGDVFTPGRTDKKIVRGEDPEPNEKYRSKVGSLNWLTMGIRYDVVYTTKELSRILSEPTKNANEILDRAIYISKELRKLTSSTPTTQ